MIQEQRNRQENIQRLKPIVDSARLMSNNGKHEEAYLSLLPYFENKEIPDCFAQECGWIIYRYLKLGKESKASIDTRKALAFYMVFSPFSMSLLHSLIMVQAVGLEKKHENDFKFVEFCLMWNLDLLREEDFERKVVTLNDGKIVEYNSMAEDVATRLYKEMKIRHTPQLAQSLLPFMRRAVAKCPKNKFLPMYVAQMYLWAGEKKTAVIEYKKLLHENPEWYIWKNLGEIVDNPSDKVSFFCKAMTMQGKEEFIGDLHLSLARLLVEENPPQALYEVKRYYDTYTKNNWTIAGEAYLIMSRLKEVNPTTRPQDFYHKNVERAEAFAYDNLAERELTYMGSFKNKAGKSRVSLAGKNIKTSVGQGAFPVLQKAEVGDVFRCRVVQHDKQWVVLTLHPTGKKKEVSRPKDTVKPSVNNEKKVTGKVSLPKTGNFAFIDRLYYVPAQIREKADLKEGQTVCAVVRQLPDGKWRVVSID